MVKGIQSIFIVWKKINVSVNSIYKLKMNDQISEDPSKTLIL